MVPVNRMILVYIMKDSLSVNLRCGDHLNFYTRISTPEREVIPGEFDYAAYLFRQQISGTAVIFPGVLAMDRQEIGIDMETAGRCMERENTGQLSEVGILGR